MTVLLDPKKFSQLDQAQPAGEDLLVGLKDGENVTFKVEDLPGSDPTEVVTSFNDRKGDVLPEANDYDDTQIHVDDTDIQEATAGGVTGDNVHEIFLSLISSFGGAITLVFGAIETIQNAAQMKAEKGQPNGYASLDGSGKVPTAQLPTSILRNAAFIGTWSANSNGINFYDGSPNSSLSSYVASLGDVLRVRTAGTIDIGHGSQRFEVDDLIFYDDTAWQPVRTVTDAQRAIIRDTTGVNTGDQDLSPYQLMAEKDQPDGYAGLDADGKINSAQLPAIAITETFPVASQAAMLALTAQQGDVAVRSDINKSFILVTPPASTLGNWQELLTPTDNVISVFGRQGVVTAQNGDYTASQITFVPVGDIAAVTVQAAIAELDTEKEKLSNKDTDGTLAANSDTKYASQKATKTYADTKLPSTYLDTDGTLAANSDTKIASQKAIVTYAKKRTGQGTGKVDGFAVRDYRILGNAYLNGVTTNTPSTNRWTFEFYDVTEPITLDRVGIEVTTAGAAGKLVRLALYTADQYLQPGTLIQDFGTVATDVGAVPTLQTITINLTLQPGRYIGIVTQDGAAAFRVITAFHLAGNALTAGTGTSPYRNITSLGGAGTVSGGYASVNPKWERDVYSGSGAAQYFMKFREVV